MNNPLLIIGALALGIASSGSAQTPSTRTPPNAQHTANGIRTEATRANNDAAGHALPLLASWNVGAHPSTPGLAPAYQIGLVEKGHHVLPSFALPFPDDTSDANAIEKRRGYYEAPLQRAAALKLPITLVSTQWERLLSDDKAYSDLPAEKNPNVVTPDGKIENKVSPFGPVELWREVGAKWVSSPLMKQVQRWYPDPPLVVLLSNNEHRKLSWKDVETDARYLKKYGKGRDDEFKRKVVAEGWIERYRALQGGMRDALSPAWRDKATFIAYTAFGPATLGRWYGWASFALHTTGRIDPEPLTWDGGSGPFYTDDWNPGTDYKVWSPQIESMNWVFMQKEALKLNPGFRFGISLWDGQEFNSRRGEKYQPKPDYYRAQGQTYGPPRYAGFAQYGLWLLRPRVLREYRGSGSDLKSMEPYFLALTAAVDRVHHNQTLKNFWRKGELVANRARQHPYQEGIPEEFRKADRWFLLDTNLDLPRPWKLDTEIPVFSLALVDGAAGNRRWLVYAHSPLRERRGVEITIPGYGKIKADVPVEGVFYVADERSKAVRRVP